MAANGLWPTRLLGHGLPKPVHRSRERTVCGRPDCGLNGAVAFPRISCGRGLDMVTDKLRPRSVHGLDMGLDWTRTWIGPSHGKCVDALRTEA